MGNSEPDLFPREEPPTFPHRTSSNEAIRFDVIRPMLQQQEATKKANEALDEALRVVRKAAKNGSIPPPLDRGPPHRQR